MNLWRSLRAPSQGRSSQNLTFSQYVDQVSFLFGGHLYGLTQTGNQGGVWGKGEIPLNNFPSYVTNGFLGNPVVGACLLARLMLFTEARFQYQRFNNGRPGELFGDQSLSLLERPDRNMTTGELLARIEQDASMAGNWYGTPRTARDGRRRLRRMRPDWSTIIAGSPSGDEDPNALDAEVIGYVYEPYGPNSRVKPITLLADQVAHFSPIPDPLANWRGVSWLTMATQNALGHSAATDHKLQFFRNGATPNMIVKHDASKTIEQVREFKDLFDEDHAGVLNAYKTLHLGGGADATVVGSHFKEMDFKSTQGTDETLICAAAQVPAVIAGVSEGLDASTYSNYAQARRKFGDHFARPQWRMVAACLETLVPPPAGTRLWYDDRDIAFLHEDAKDAGEVMKTNAEAVKSLTEAGYEPDSVIKAVDAGDITLLQHSGLHSVQLHAPGANPAPPAPAA